MINKFNSNNVKDLQLLVIQLLHMLTTNEEGWHSDWQSYGISKEDEKIITNEYKKLEKELDDAHDKYENEAFDAKKNNSANWAIPQESSIATSMHNGKEIRTKTVED